MAFETSRFDPARAHDWFPIPTATTEARFYEALGADPAKPDGWVRT